MVRITSIISLVLVGLVAARPVPVPLAKRAFAEQQYSAFQISDGTAGNAQAEANKVFVDPFKGRDLAKVTAAELKAVQNMREAAEAAEVDQFNKQISAASGNTATTLQNGKIKNKVLKLTGEVQAIQIKIAQSKAAGKDTSSDEAKLKEEQTKLTKNIATDAKNKGQASKGVA
ncbi:hypothetical protein BN14_09127 [Rhizoctonia solani AG-1 IB]|uniref:Small secreted protein n=1 Tax=Thanatephorus cucumeris (strain AG1-IB / isolate 7/3/14) TaxID=1108050 RepID=M5C6R5_THACB|nr:hypothetical protein BN14_09127 [Rhizoctonia solani AG-1 IB]